MGESYLVDGAELCCMHGSKSGTLRVISFCYMAGEKCKAKIKDCCPKRRDRVTYRRLTGRIIKNAMVHIWNFMQRCIIYLSVV